MTKAKPRLQGEKLRQWRAENPTKQTEYARRWREKNPEYRAKPQSKKWYRNYMLKAQYNLTIEEWEKLFEDQGRKCKLCGRQAEKELNNYRLWHTDHDHITGKFRGILCTSCNRDIVILDNEEKLLKAINYVNRPSLIGRLIDMLL